MHKHAQAAGDASDSQLAGGPRLMRGGTGTGGATRQLRPRRAVPGMSQSQPGVSQSQPDGDKGSDKVSDTDSDTGNDTGSASEERVHPQRGHARRGAPGRARSQNARQQADSVGLGIAASEQQGSKQRAKKRRVAHEQHEQRAAREQHEHGQAERSLSEQQGVGVEEGEQGGRGNRGFWSEMAEEENDSDGAPEQRKQGPRRGGCVRSQSEWDVDNDDGSDGAPEQGEQGTRGGRAHLQSEWDADNNDAAPDQRAQARREQGTRGGGRARSQSQWDEDDAASDKADPSGQAGLAVQRGTPGHTPFARALSDGDSDEARERQRGHGGRAAGRARSQATGPSNTMPALPGMPSGMPAMRGGMPGMSGGMPGGMAGTLGGMPGGMPGIAGGMPGLNQTPLNQDGLESPLSQPASLLAQASIAMTQPPRYAASPGAAAMPRQFLERSADAQHVTQPRAAGTQRQIPERSTAAAAAATVDEVMPPRAARQGGLADGSYFHQYVDSPPGSTRGIGSPHTGPQRRLAAQLDVLHRPHAGHREFRELVSGAHLPVNSLPVHWPPVRTAAAAARRSGTATPVYNTHLAASGRPDAAAPRSGTAAPVYNTHLAASVRPTAAAAAAGTSATAQGFAINASSPMPPLATSAPLSLRPHTAPSHTAHPHTVAHQPFNQSYTAHQSTSAAHQATSRPYQHRAAQQQHSAAALAQLARSPCAPFSPAGLSGVAGYSSGAGDPDSLADALREWHATHARATAERAAAQAASAALDAARAAAEAWQSAEGDARSRLRRISAQSSLRSSNAGSPVARCVPDVITERSVGRPECLQFVQSLARAMRDRACVAHFCAAVAAQLPCWQPCRQMRVSIVDTPSLRLSLG